MSKEIITNMDTKEEVLLQIRDLRVKYTTDDAVVYAVNGLDLDVHPGETLGLVGETGAGKTTTALSIMKLLPEKISQVEGEIMFNGHDIINATRADMRLVRGAEVSMIFQDPMTSLNPVIKIGDQLAEALELHKIDMSKKDIDNRVDEILRMVGIDPARKSDYPHQFSGGMRQRVVIAMALACEPKLLLADEPTTALDVTIQAQVLKMMRELKEELSTAMILITHDLGVVAQTCDRVAIMYAGEIIEVGTVQDIFEGAEHHPYTIGLFGSIPELSRNSRRLNPIDGMMPDPTIRQEGCAFAERCKHCMEKCRTEHPNLNSADGHLIRCHLHGEKKVTE